MSDNSRLCHEHGCKRVQVVVRKLEDAEVVKESYSPEDLEALRMVMDYVC